MSITENIIIKINNKILQLNNIKKDIEFILNKKDSNDLCKSLNLKGKYAFEIIEKLNILLEHVDEKINVCNIKKNEFENKVDLYNYNNWISFLNIKNKDIEDIMSDIEELESNNDIFQISEIDTNKEDYDDLDNMVNV